MAFGAFKHALHNNFVKAIEAVTPHQTESNFKTTGVMAQSHDIDAKSAVGLG